MADKAQYVTLGVANKLFAAPIEKVQEILDMCPIAGLPQSPDNLLGMIDVRGLGVPVIDLRLTLGLPSAPDNENTRIIVLAIEREGEQITMGLKADRVFEVTVLDELGLDRPPAVGGGWSGHCIAGIGRRNGAFVTVLDLDELLGNGRGATVTDTPQLV